MKNTEEKLITYEWGRAGVAGAREEGSLAQEWPRNGPGMASKTEKKGSGLPAAMLFLLRLLAPLHPPLPV